MHALYAIPSFALLVAVLAVAIALTGFGQNATHRMLRRQGFIEHNEVGGIMIAVAGTLYAVVLGFLTVVVWQHYLDARQLVVQESDADIDAWHEVVGLPSAIRTRVRDDMLAYAQIMVRKEWPAMRAGGSDPKAAMIVMDAIDAVASHVPANGAESNAQQATMQQLTAMHDSRQQRININENGVSGFEWSILGIGGMAIVGFCWLFGLRNARIQFVMTATVVTIIVSTLVLLFELQYPFRSDIGIGPDSWTGALDHIHMMQTGDMENMRE